MSAVNVYHLSARDNRVGISNLAHAPAPGCEIPGCSRLAAESTLCYHVLGSAPHRALLTCSSHRWHDHPDLFRCENCDRVMVGEFNHERCKVELNGDLLCLDCAARRHFRLPQSWIKPRAVKAIVHEPRWPDAFYSQAGVLNIARCPHVLAHKQPLPPGIVFVGNVEFDYLGRQQTAAARLAQIIERLDQPFCPVLGGANQFSVGLGIYVRKAVAHA